MADRSKKSTTKHRSSMKDWAAGFAKPKSKPKSKSKSTDSE